MPHNAGIGCGQQHRRPVCHHAGCHGFRAVQRTGCSRDPRRICQNADLLLYLPGDATYERNFRAYREANGMKLKSWTFEVLNGATSLEYMDGRENMTAMLKGRGFPLK